MVDVGTFASENDLDFGIVNDTGVGEFGEGLLLRLPFGLALGVDSREWRKLELRLRHGSVSKVGRPVAEVVVVQVLVDIRRIRLGGKLRRNRYKIQKTYTLKIVNFIYLKTKHLMVNIIVEDF